jgi:Outer membrane protein beta-barrel domain
MKYFVLSFTLDGKFRRKKMKIFVSAFLAFFNFLPLNNLEAALNPVFYLRSFAGTNFLSMNSDNSIKLRAEPGIMVGAGAGYRFDDFRIELECSYRFNNYDALMDAGPHLYLDGGSMQKFSSIVNIYYTLFKSINNSIFDFYIGSGLGIRVDLEELEFSYFNNFELIELERFSDNRKGMTGQMIAGLSMPIKEKILADIQYRFMKDSSDCSNHSFLFNISKEF